MNLSKPQRIKDMVVWLGVSRATIYRLLEQDPYFPRPFYLSNRTVAWDPIAVSAWIERRKKSSLGKAEVST